MSDFFTVRTFTCSNYSAAAVDRDVMAYLPCPVPFLPEAENFTWELDGVMNLPLNYTCGTTTYADEAPMYLISKILYSLAFAYFTYIPLKWMKSGTKSRNRKLRMNTLNAQEQVYCAVFMGSFCSLLSQSILNFYETDGPPQVTLFLQCISAWCIDVALVLAITGWTGMNNIQGRKPVVPKKYQVLKKIAIECNLFIQILALSMEPYITTIGDERVTSDYNTNYSYYDGNISIGRQLANFLTETGYVIVLFIEGKKLSKTLKAGKDGENPAAQKILKYMRATSFVLPVCELYRLSVMITRVGTTGIGSVPICSAMWSFISLVDIIFLFIFGAALYVLQPTKKSKKIKPNGDKTSFVTTFGKSTTDESD
mmetsp:Transcript_17301/g.35649  ORF Transcript_17301/g.35649 Transcript_17301/m.35649 type:complete len:368 (+) Transcript_17301:71-1174(+)